MEVDLVGVVPLDLEAAEAAVAGRATYSSSKLPQKAHHSLRDSYQIHSWHTARTEWCMTPMMPCTCRSGR